VTVVAAGLVVGVPVGVVLGRAAWRASIHDLGMVEAPTVPLAQLSGVAIVALVVAAVVSVPPAFFASHGRPAESLRAE